MSMDFESEAAKTPAASLERAKALAQELRSALSDVETIEQNLQSMKSLANKIKTKDLPEIMQEMQLASFKLDDGTLIEITEFASGSIPKDEEKAKDALAYLEELGASDLIRTFIEMTFDKSQSKEAKKAMDLLKKANFQFSVSSNVHAGSLAAFVRERMKSGEKIDPSRLGVYFGNIAKIKEPKVSKKGSAK